MLAYWEYGPDLLPAALMLYVPLYVGILFLACCRRSGQPSLIATAIREATDIHASKLRKPGTPPEAVGIMLHLLLEELR